MCTLDVSVNALKGEWADDHVCFEFHTSKDVLRIGMVDKEWKWLEPFERGNEPRVNKRNESCIRMRMNAHEFRTPDTKTTAQTENFVIETADGLDVNLPQKRKSKAEREAFLQYDLRSIHETGVAFCVRMYYLDTMFNDKNDSHRVWSWVSGAVVRWKHVLSTGTQIGVQTFMRSHTAKKIWCGDCVLFRRTNLTTSINATGENVVQKSLLQSTAYTAEVYAAANSMQATEPDMNDYKACTYGIVLEGAQGKYDHYEGVSMQSWFKMPRGAPVTSEWIAARIHEIQRLHSVWTTPDEVTKGLLGCESPTALHTVYLRDVIRLCTIHNATRPYIPDHDVEWRSSDLYSSGLVIPGDCEDGAHAAYSIYMHLLFGEHEFAWLRTYAQLLGVPLGVLGAARDPTVPNSTDLASHCFCVVLPFPMYWKAMTGSREGWQEAFYKAYKYRAPKWLENADACVMETTIHCTASYSSTATENAGVIEVIKKYEKSPTSPRNLSYVHVNSADRSAQYCAMRAYGDAHERLNIEPRLWQRSERASKNTCSFAFVCDGKIGVRVSELKKAELYALKAMPEETRDLEDKVLRDVRRPVVALMNIQKDEYKPMEKWVEGNDAARTCCMRKKGMVFVYDRRAVKVGMENELCNAFGASRYEYLKYGWSWALVFY